MIVTEKLTEKNYKDWSDQVKNYLLANDLWDVFGNYGLSDRAWKTKNSQALRAIQWACGSEQAFSIKRCKTAKEAWEHLKCRETWAPNLLDCYDGMGADIKRYINFMYGGDAIALGSCSELENAVISTFFPGNNTLVHQAVYRGNEAIVKILVDKASQEIMELQNDNGYTALMLTAIYFRDIKVAEALMGNDQESKKRLLCNKVEKGKHKDFIPVLVAADVGHKDLTHFLHKQTASTAIEIYKNNNYHLATKLLHICIKNEILDVAIDLLRLLGSEWSQWTFFTTPNEEDPDEEGPDKEDPILALAHMPSYFASGNSYKWWEKLVYRLLRVSHMDEDNVEDNTNSQSNVSVRTEVGSRGRQYQPTTNFHLTSFLSNLLSSIFVAKRGENFVEVKPRGINKGLVAKKVLSTLRNNGKPQDFVLCIGKPPDLGF